MITLSRLKVILREGGYLWYTLYSLNCIDRRAVHIYGILYRVWDPLDSYDPLIHNWWWKEVEIVRVSIP